MSSEFLYWWLGYSALMTLLVLTLGSGAALLCRQPTRRLPIIELSLAGCLIAPWLGMIPGYPQLTVGWPAHQPAATAPVLGPQTPLADRCLAKNRAPSPFAAREGQGDFLPSLPAALPANQIAAAAEPPAPARDVGSWLVAFYLFGVALGVAWWLVGVAALMRIVWTARPAPPRCRQLLEEIAGRPVDRLRLLASRRAKQPFAFAWGRAVIVLPENLCHDEQAARWALAHEWAHVERHDFRAWFIAGLARLLFFYQPLVWWLRRQLRLCQDFVADARASRQTPQPEDYAEFLTIRAAAGSLHPAMVGLGMGFRKSELYRRVIMLVENPSLESRPPRLWTVSVTCAALALMAVVAALSLTPRAAAEGEAAAVKPATTSATKPFTAKFPSGVEVELLGVSKHPSKHDSWWRPDGSPLAERPCDPVKGSLSSSPHHVVREFEVQFHHQPAESMGTEVLFDPPYDSCFGDSPRRLDHTGFEAMTVSLPDQPTVTVRVLVAAGPWETVYETAKGGFSTGTMKGGFAFSPIYEKDGRVIITVTYNIVGPQSRVVAVGVDGREHRADSSTNNGADGFVQFTGEFSGLSPKDIKAFRVQTRPYEQVEFRNVSLQPGQKTDVQVVEGTPHGIQPFDLLTIRVLGTMIFAPIDGIYLVEPSGQVSLGPAYGRARVQGLTVEGAEAAVHAQLKKILVKPDVQVTAAGHASQWRGGRVPAASSRISPDDLLEIRVLGTMLDQPIDGNMAVEPSGTIPLGPAYGRVMVKGLTLEEAEKAITKHLEKVLTKPDVSVTLAGWKDDAQLKADREAAAARHERELKEWAERKKEKDQKRPGSDRTRQPSAAGPGKSASSMNLNGWLVTDADLARIKGLAQLQSLNLSNAQVTDAGLENLKGLTNLQSLDLTFTKVTDAGLKHLEGLTNLCSLDLGKTKVTNAGLEHLRGLTKLRSLNLAETKVTEAGRKALQKALPNCGIQP